MKRDQLDELIHWKESKYRKPLIVRGARQTGKTWLLKEFGNHYFKNVVYINFEEAPNLQSLFLSDFDIIRIRTTLEIHSHCTINPDETLIIFDEIQAAEKGITSLKYFHEKAPEYFIVAAGSLLGMGLHSNVSFPVGKVNFLDLRPMSFTEFLTALNEESLAGSIKNQAWDVATLFHNKLTEYLKYYYYVGGMPEVVQFFADTRDWDLVRKIQRQILLSYEGDFSKHAPVDIVPRIRMVWQSIPAQLAKENKKFIYGVLKEGARAKEFEMAIQWLIDCGLLLRSHRISKPHMPLIAYQDFSAFKLYLHDTGLLGAMAGLNIRILIEGDELFTEFKGALTEQFVMQQLRLKSDRYIGYWTNERNTAEVDFIIQDEGAIIPIEVKSGENPRSKSFRLFCDKFKPAKALRTSILPWREEDWMVNIPLYAIS